MLPEASQYWIHTSDLSSTCSFGYHPHARVGLVFAHHPLGSGPGLLVRSDVP